MESAFSGLFYFIGKGGVKEVGSPLPRRCGSNSTNTAIMVLQVDVSIKELFRLERHYPWEKPGQCLRCRGRVWGHGFVGANFDGYDQPLWLKRYQCPDCGCIIRLRPRGYFKRFQATITTIRDCLVYWVRYHRWKAGPSPPRQRHWINALRTHLVLQEGLNRVQDLVAGFDRLWDLGIIPVSRSL